MIYKNEYFTLPSRRRYLFSPALAFPLPSSHTFSPLYFSPDPYPRRIPDSGFFAFLHTARNISVVFPVLFFFHSRFRSDDKPGTSERIEHPGTGDAQFNYSARSDGGGGGGGRNAGKKRLYWRPKTAKNRVQNFFSPVPVAALGFDFGWRLVNITQFTSSTSIESFPQWRR